MTNKEILELFNSKFGTNVASRCRKLTEEYHELMEVLDNANVDDLQSEHCKEFAEDFIDELSDLNAVVFHIAGILGLTQDELLSMAADKVVGREKDPNYKRKHPHVKHKYEKP